MFRKTIFSIAIFMVVNFNLLYSQTDTSTPVDTIQKDTFWKIGGDIGLNFNQIMFINPRVGSGDNRIGFGGLMNLFATYKKDKFIWANSLKLQYAIQRLGKSSAENPFEKTIDNIRFGTAIGYQAFSDKTFWAFDATFDLLLQKVLNVSRKLFRTF